MAFKLNNKKNNEQHHNGQKKIKYSYKLGFLNKLIGYTMRHAPAIVNKRSLINLRELLLMSDDTQLRTNDQLYGRFELLLNILEMRVVNKVDDETIILEYCLDSSTLPEVTENLVQSISDYKNITFEEMKALNNIISDRLKYGRIVYENLEEFREIIIQSDANVNVNMKALTKRVVEAAKKTIADYRDIENTQSDKVISFESEDFWDRTWGIVEEILDPSTMVRTGIQSLNTILGGGYYGARLYTYLGLPAGFKSGILAKSVIDIKTYNKNLETKEEGTRKTVVYVTMENDLNETIERLFNMNITIENIRNFETDEVIDMMKKSEQNAFGVKDKDDINVVLMYYPNNSISTDDLYTIIDRIEEDNAEVIALVLDYIKRIRPAEFAAEEKTQLKNVSNELKSLATEYKIPVITAHQLNRSAAATIDAALTDEKEDITKLVGRGNVGTAWEVMENTDWACIINVEKKRDTGEYFLTFKRVKIRYRHDSELEYFNHPFAVGNRIQLIDDINNDQPLSELSLSTNFEGIDVSTGRKGSFNAVERQIIRSSSNDIFSFDKSIS